VNFGLSSLDDETIIHNITNIAGNKINPKEAFTRDAFVGDKGDKFYRPMQSLSLMIDAEIGRGELWVFHFSNLLLHILTVISLFFFLKKIGIKEQVSFLLSLFFSLNPMFTNAVAWIPARGDLLLCLFSLLSFITFLEYMKNRNKVYLISHLIVIAGAVFSKETSVLLPVLILFYFYYVSKNKIILKDIVPFFTIWVLLLSLFYYLRLQVIKGSISSNVFGIVPFIKNLPTIPITFGKFFIPYDLSTLPLFNTISLIIGFIILLSFAAVTAKFIRGEKRIVIWGSVWFLAFTVPPMLFRSHIADVGIEYYDYRAYLPIIGILVILGILINSISQKFSFNKILRLSIPILLIYAIIAFNFTTVFADPISFFTSAIDSNSKNALAFNSRGIIYMQSKMFEPSLADFDNSIRISPAYSAPYFNKGWLYHSINDIGNADHFFSLALKYDTLYSQSNMLGEHIYVYLSTEKINLGQSSEAISIIKEGLRKYPVVSSLHDNLGLAYYICGKLDSALYEFNTAIKLEKIDSYYNNRGMAENGLKVFNNALSDFRKALELNPDFFDAYINSGIAKINLNDYEGAISDFNTAIRLDPSSGLAYYNRGTAYSKINKPAEAEKDLSEAHRLGFK
jgi:tetratricopeptide (TPR) repeat protein